MPYTLQLRSTPMKKFSNIRKKLSSSPLALAFVLSVFLLAGTVALVLCLPRPAKPAVEVTAVTAQDPAPLLTQAPAAPPPEPIPPAFEEFDITLMAVGDNLLHLGIVHTGDQPDGTRNYDFLFEDIRSFLEKSDIKIINQETIFGGNQLGFQGYPTFNSPTEVGDAIAAAGFNVVLQSSNHTADQGLSGMQNCIDFWKTHPEVLVTGLHEPFDDAASAPNPEPDPASEPDAASKTDSAAVPETDSDAGKTPDSRIPILEIKGRTFAILNYAYGPNAASVSSSVAQRMNILCAIDENSRMIDFTTLNPQVLADIKMADELADVVIVCPHWGTEYATVPSAYQETFARQMAEAGADVIIGTHPHVVQPVAWVEAENGNRALCYYSLGNYASTQRMPLSMLEGLAWITFHVTEDAVSITEQNTGIVPLICHYSSGPVRFKHIYPLEDYTEELAASHGIIPYGGVSFPLGKLQQWSEEILGGWTLPADTLQRIVPIDAQTETPPANAQPEALPDDTQTDAQNETMPAQ